MQNEFSSEQLMLVVDRVGMSKVICSFPEQLETVIINDGYREDTKLTGGQVDPPSCCIIKVHDGDEELLSMGDKALSGEYFLILLFDGYKRING